MFLILGQGPAGWTFATGEHLNDLLPFRVPRIVSAGTAGAMLGTAGAVLQRLTGNPLASPEVLGVSAGAGVGLAVALMVAPQHPIFLLLGLAAGSAVTLLMILSVTAKSGFGPERLLLTGIGTGAFCMAIVATVLSKGDLRSYALLVWMSGSTNNAGPIEAWSGLVSAFMLIPPILLLRRWLDILPLGEMTARSVGLRLGTARLVLAVLAALLTAVASFLVGPLSLVGLIAPHLARRLGFLRAVHQLAGSALIGFGITVFADWSARAIAFPYQIPVGLFAALIGGPYLIWLLTRRETINA
jgi:iron complex transport system permease protein